MSRRRNSLFPKGLSDEAAVALGYAPLGIKTADAPGLR